MVPKKEIKKIINKPIDKLFQILLKGFDSNSWTIIYKDDFKVTNKKIKEIFGVFWVWGERNLSTFKTYMFQGSPVIPFFIKLKELDNNKTEIFVVVGYSHPGRGVKKEFHLNLVLEKVSELLT